MAINGGDPGEAFASALRLAAGDTMGAVLANEIGTYAAFNGISDGAIAKIVMHAAAGCAAGAASSGDCIAGAIGSGLSELLDQPLAEAVKDPAEQTALLALIAGTGAALAQKDINTAADTAGLTHQYNYLSHAEMMQELKAAAELKNCQANAGSCSADRMASLKADIVRLKTLDDLRDAELELTCAYGGALNCGVLLKASSAAMSSYYAAEDAAKAKGMSLADYIASIGGDANKDALVAELKSIDEVRRKTSQIIGARDTKELDAMLKGLGLGASGGAVVAGGYLIAASAIPAAIRCLGNPVCVGDIAALATDALAGEALGGASLMPTIGTVAGVTVVKKGDAIIGVLDEASGKMLSITSDAGRASYLKQSQSFVDANKFATNSGEAVFWSGKSNGIGGADIAACIASACGGTTLEQLAKSRGISLPIWDSANPAVVAEWKNASKLFAQNASGDVTAVIDKDLRPGNIWETVELSELIANPKISSVTGIDPKAGSKFILFKR